MADKIYTGRTKISIPVSKEAFLEDPTKYIEYYLSKCIQTNKENKEQCDELNKVYKGEQEILNKTRVNGDEANNNQIVINHAYRHIEFKKGFTVGNPIEYSLTIDNNESDDLSYLSKYFNDCQKAEKDIDKYEDIFKYGYALQFIIPRTEEFDEESEAPFELYNVEVGTAFKVYSGDIKSEPLFDVVIGSRLDEDFKEIPTYEVYYQPSKDSNCILMVSEDPQKFAGAETSTQPYKFLPLIEYSLNKNRIGLVEIGLILGNALNLIESNQLDNLLDYVNSYLVFENIDTKKGWNAAVAQMRQTRTIKIKSTSPQLPAKVYTLNMSLQHSEIKALYEILRQELYDIVAVPLSSGNVSSGGDTGEARILGNGWESAQNQAKVDTTYVSQFERELLKKVFMVCAEYGSNKLNEISPNQISIKYSINMSNNIYTKSQALSNLYAMNFPYEEALSTVGIVSDIHGVGKKWRELDESRKTSEDSQSETSNNETSTENVDNQVAETTQVDEA